MIAKMSGRKVYFFLTLLVFFAYANSLQNGFLSDDVDIIVKNSNLGTIKYLFPLNPLALRPPIYNIIYLVFGRAPAFFRLLNVFFHLGGVFVTYSLVSFLLNNQVAFFTAAILAVHPLQTEGVVWVSGGPYAQYTFFLMLSLLLYAKSKQNQKLYWPSILAFFLALLSQEKAIVYPLILIIFSWAYGDFRRDWKKIIPFFLVGAFFVVYYLGLIGQRVTSLASLHAEVPVRHNPVLQIPIAVASYVKLVFWPSCLTLYHSEIAYSISQYTFALLIFFVLLGLLVFAWIKKNRNYIFWLSLFFISLLPTLTPWGISWVVAERYVYWGSIGLYVLVAIIFNKLHPKFANQYFTLAVFLVVVSSLLIRTVLRNRDWQDIGHLSIANAKCSPSSPNNHNNLAEYYVQQGDLAKAAEEYAQVVALKPNYYDALHNLANTYQKMGKMETAIEYYQRAIQINPNLWESYKNLGTIYFLQKNYDQARQNIEKAISLKPDNSSLHSNLGAVYLEIRKLVEAKKEFEKALQLDPDNKYAHQGLEMIK